MVWGAQGSQGVLHTRLPLGTMGHKCPWRAEESPACRGKGSLHSTGGLAIFLLHYFQQSDKLTALDSCASLSGQPFWGGKDCWFTGLGRNGILSRCCCLPAAVPNCAILSRMWSKTLLTCGSLHGRAGDCSSVLGHSACVWLWGTGCWRGGCWVQQCPRFPLQKKRRYFSFYPCSPLPPVITTLSPLHPTDKALWNTTHF